MRVSEIKDEDLTNEIIETLVFDNVEDDRNTKGDCIIVLGGICPLLDRVPKAVELYKQDRAKKILMSGGAKWDFEYGYMSEADYMAKGAIAMGVSPDDVICENMSVSTFENMICSSLELLRHFEAKNIRDLLLVTSFYHMKRSKMIADIMLPAHFKAYCCPARGYITKENWNSDPDRERKTLKEVKLIRKLVSDGLYRDFDI
ncbi:MAG: YdcF family protein [Clostridia bacterium]|nr:YdcF family protein [Clostridia bacterium]